MPNYSWENLLKIWSEQLISSRQLAESLPYLASEQVSSSMVASGWLGYQGVSEQQLIQAESRLKVQLPPSYRDFLRITNGWGFVGTNVDMILPIEDVDWYSSKYPEHIDAYFQGLSLGMPQNFHQIVPDDKYLIYGATQNPYEFREEYLKSALLISTADSSPYIYLLNPKIVNTEGEWEAWVFEAETGANRYRSFWDLMQAEHNLFLFLEKHIANL